MVILNLNSKDVEAVEDLLVYDTEILNEHDFEDLYSRFDPRGFDFVSIALTDHEYDQVQKLIKHNGQVELGNTLKVNQLYITE